MTTINLIWRKKMNGKSQYFCHSVTVINGRTSFLKSRISRSYYWQLQDEGVLDITHDFKTQLLMRAEAIKQRNIHKRQLRESK